MTFRTRFVVGAACLALAMGACKGDKKDKGKEKPAPKTTEAPKPKPPEAKPKTTAELAAGVAAGWDAFNKGDMDAFGKHYAADATLELVDSGQPVAQGRDAVLGVVGMFRAAMPDLKGEQQLFLASGNRVVTADLMYGTQSGELMGVPASGNKVGVMVLHVFDLNDKGEITKEVAYFDAPTLMGQIGAMKMPHREAMEPSGSNAEPVIGEDGDAEKANLDLMSTADGLMNEHKVDDMLAMVADDAECTDYTMPADMKKADLGKMFKGFMKAFPDAKGETEWSMAAGDYVVRAMTVTGTNKGPMPAMGLKKATNKPITMRFVDVGMIEDGKFAHLWTFGNSMGMAQQLGLIEPPKDK